MLDLFRDLRFATRRLLKAPGFTAAALLTLAVGIGGNAAIFSFVDGILLRPLPYPRPDRLVHPCETNVEQMGDWCAASPANAEDWARLSHTLQSIGLARSWQLSWRSEGRTVGVRGGIATPGVFSALRVTPALGRLFEARDLERGGEHVAIVSQSFWSNRLGGNDALGRQIQIDGDAYEVIGVLPEGFEVPFIDSVDVWIPLWPERRDSREWRGFIPYARLADGASLPQAQAEMEAIRLQLATEYPDTNAAWGVSVQSLHERLTRPVRPTLLVFLVAVGLVLAIACTNVANLMLARSFTRERENAVRMALGAGRTQIIRELLSESLLLSLGGGLLGLLLALWAVDLLVGLAPAWFPRLEGVQVTYPVLGCTALLSLVSCFTCGLIPALHSSDVNLTEALKTGRAWGERSRGSSTRSLLVVTEMALALLLLVGAGLLIRSFANLLDWKPGFDRSRVAVVQLFSSPGKHSRAETIVQLFERAADEVRALPSVTAVGAGSAVPLWGGDGEQEFYVEGRPIPPAGQRPSVSWFDVDTGYFQTLGMPLIRGRFFTAADRRGMPPVAIINETMARHYWPDESAVGQRVRLLAHEETFEVVGVVGDVQPFRPDQKPKAQIYWPFAQFPRGAVQLIVRISGEPAQTFSSILARLEKVDPDMEIGRIYTMDDLVDRQLTSPRFIAILAVIFGLIALVIASVGVYGVMSFAVAQRTQEIGIRMALGADRAQILLQVLRRGLLLAACGVLIGLAGALALTRLLASLLVDLAPTDVATFAGGSAVLLLVATAACCLPARRATQVDPMLVMRSE